MRSSLGGRTRGMSPRPTAVRFVAALLFCCLAAGVYIRTTPRAHALFPAKVWGKLAQTLISKTRDILQQAVPSGVEGAISTLAPRPRHPRGYRVDDLGSVSRGHPGVPLTYISLPPPSRFLQPLG